MARTRSQRLALHAAVLALAARRSAVVAQTFVTSLVGLGGTPVGLTPLNTVGASVMSLYSLASVDPDAVCNDGTPAGYYFAPGTGSGATQWLVYLEGSMFCWDGLSCHERYSSRKYWMSSSTWASQMAQGGIFDTANSAFGNANRIYVKYCSSDLWSGDVAASSATFNFAFRGARIVSAVMTALVEQHGMSGPGNQLLFGGCSAGAIGAMNNLDAVAAQLASTGVEVKGLLDAAALVDIYPAAWPFSPDLIPLQTLVEELVYTIQPTFPASCAAKGYTGPAQWKCLWSAYRLPLVETPFFANAVQFDDFEIQYSTDNLGPSNPQQMEFVNSFQPAFLNLINSLPPGSGVFSPTCLVHCLSGQNTYFEFYVNGETMSSALNAWYFDGQPTSVVSSCTGWACTAQCGVTSKGTPCNMALSTKTQTCQAVSLPTTETDEPPPATEDAVQLLPAAWYAQQQAQEQQQGQVQQSEGSLSPAQQQQLQSVVQQHQQQQQGRRMLAAATRSCCGAE